MSPGTGRLMAWVAVAVVGALGIAWSGYGAGAVAARRPLVVRPFVLERDVVSYTSDPRGTVIRREEVARRSDGTLVTRLIPVPGALSPIGSSPRNGA